MEGLDVTVGTEATIVPPPNRGISDELNVQQRFLPRCGEFLYLCNSDPRLSVDTLASASPLTILDFGADLALYHPLFPSADYRLADISEHGRVDDRISADGTVPQRSETFDLILSTQVAEHLTRPDAYFTECFRLLKPGGRLFVSAHGAFEDHGFPHDYQRWTAEGLRRDLDSAGFEAIALTQLTVGPRALVFLMERCLESTWMPRRHLSGIVLWLARKLERSFRAPIHWLADHWFHDYRVVPTDRLYHNIHIGIVAVAVLPAESQAPVPA